MTYGEAVWFASAILFVFLFMFAFLWVGWWATHRVRPPSPYTGLPLKTCSDLSYVAIARVYKFMTRFYEYDNRMFKIRRAALCRETGRIFPNSISWLGKVQVDWDFLRKRYPGNYVSWGSLTAEQQKDLWKSHGSLSDFQTELSSPKPSPRAVEPLYAYAKPGPLYVDLETNVVLGWQCVPETDLEVLIVQKPKRE